MDKSVSLKDSGMTNTRRYYLQDPLRHRYPLELYSSYARSSPLKSCPFKSFYSGSRETKISYFWERALEASQVDPGSFEVIREAHVIRFTRKIYNLLSPESLLYS